MYAIVTRGVYSGVCCTFSGIILINARALFAIRAQLDDLHGAGARCDCGCGRFVRSGKGKGKAEGHDGHSGEEYGDIPEQDAFDSASS